MKMDDLPLLPLIASLHAGKTLADRVRECRYRRQADRASAIKAETDDLDNYLKESNNEQPTNIEPNGDQDPS